MGDYKIACLNTKEVPILLSVQSLSEMGAVIDFRTCAAFCRNLAHQSFVQLETETNGNLFLSLAEDVLSHPVLNRDLLHGFRGAARSPAHLDKLKSTLRQHILTEGPVNRTMKSQTTFLHNSTCSDTDRDAGTAALGTCKKNEQKLACGHGTTAPDSNIRESHESSCDHAHKREPCAPKGSDSLEFGKHGAKTYQEVLKLDHEYCRRVDQVEEQHYRRKLRRFASWQKMQSIYQKLYPENNTTQDRLMRRIASQECKHRKKSTSAATHPNKNVSTQRQHWRRRRRRRRTLR